jgi:hypothetical protein
MDAVIHIGMPKAGSSTLQEFLQSNVDGLSRQGFVYTRFDPRMGSQFEFPLVGLTATQTLIPPAFERNLLNLHDLAAQAAYVDRYTRHLQAQLAQAAAHKCFIGSSEHAYPWLNTQAKIAALDQFLCARFRHVRYILYLRHPEEFILSGYSEAIRRGERLSLAAHLRRAVRVNHAVQVDRWVKAVGRDRFALRPLSRDVLHGGDLLTDFCRLAGIDTTGLTRAAPVNIGLSVQELRLRRVLNMVLPVQGKDGLMHPAYRMAIRVFRPFLRRSTRPSLTEAQRRQVHALNAEDTEKLRRRFFPGRAELF